MGEFIFVVCQFGAEKPIKNDVLSSAKSFRLAFSRPGLLTFKRDVEVGIGSTSASLSFLRELPSAPLVRLCGLGIGNVRGETDAERVERTIELAGTAWDAIHVFPRDPCLPGSHGFEPCKRNSEDNCEAALKIALAARSIALPINASAKMGQRILDIVVADSNQWFIGWHRAAVRHECWPGGALSLSPPIGMISRAYLKIAEALAWSGLPMKQEDWVVEIGSSPGGACQRLLDVGMRVTGVDAAEMDPQLLQHPRFEHWRGKAATIRRKKYAKFRWLVADANVAPNYTLDVVEDIVSYPGNKIEGLLLTLKLSSWENLQDLPPCVERIRALGFEQVDVKQLASNRRECCLMAMRTGIRPSRLPSQATAELSKGEQALNAKV